MRKRTAYTTLTVVGGQGAAAATTRIASSAQQQSRANLAFVTREWAQIGDFNQRAWNMSAREWAAQLGLPPDGFSLFKSVGLVKLLMGQDLSPIAPTLPDLIPHTPDFSVEATLSAAGVFQLAIVTPVAATGPFLVAATAAKSQGTSRFFDGQYRVLTIADDFVAGQSAMTADFMGVFLRTPPLGSKVSVQITPLTPNGFRGTPGTEYTVVQPPPALGMGE